MNQFGDSLAMPDTPASFHFFAGDPDGANLTNLYNRLGDLVFRLDLVASYEWQILNLLRFVLLALFMVVFCEFFLVFRKAAR